MVNVAEVYDLLEKSSSEGNARFSLELFSRAPTNISTPDSDQQKIPKRIAETLWRELPIAHVAVPTMEDTEAVTRLALSSYEKVKDWYRELQTFTEVVIKANVEIRGSDDSVAVDNAIEACVEHVKADLKPAPIPPESFIDYRFASLPTQEASKKAEAELWSACKKFADDVFSHFQNLQERCVLGSVQFAEKSCKYIYWQRVAIFETTTRKSSSSDFSSDLFGNLLTQTEQVASDFQARLAQTTHHAINVTLSDPRHSEDPLPEKYCKLIESAPVWLREHIQLLEGDLIREQRVEIDTHQLQVLGTPEITTIRLPAFDPAILIGGFVFAGWGEIELAKIRAKESQASEREERLLDRRNASVQGVGSLAAAVTGSIVMVAANWVPSLAIGAILLFTTALFLAFNASKYWQLTSGSNQHAALSQVLGASTFGVVGCFLTSYGLGRSAVAFIAGMACCCVAFAVGRRVLQSSPDREQR